MYSSTNIVRVIKKRRIRWAGHEARMRTGDTYIYTHTHTHTHTGFWWRPEGKSPLGRPRHGWYCNIKMDLQEVAWVGMDWIDLAQDRDRWWTLVNAVMNLRVPKYAGKFLTS